MHKRTSHIVGSVLAAAALAGALASPVVTLAQATQPTTQNVYLALGDSLAFGVGAKDVGPTPPGPSPRLGYVPRLSNFFRGASHGGVTHTVNLSVPGETSTTFISRDQLGSALNVIDASSDIKVVTLDIGGNDLLGLVGNQACNPDPTVPGCSMLVAGALKEFSTNYPFILGALRTSLASDPGGARLMIMTLYNPFSGTGKTSWEAAVDTALLGEDRQIDCGALKDESRMRDVGLNDLIACIGTAAGATVVDVYPAFEGKGATLTHILDNPSAPDIHPTNAGYAQIAATFEKAWR